MRVLVGFIVRVLLQELTIVIHQHRFYMRICYDFIVFLPAFYILLIICKYNNILFSKYY